MSYLKGIVPRWQINVRERNDVSVSNRNDLGEPQTTTSLPNKYNVFEWLRDPDVPTYTKYSRLIAYVLIFDCTAKLQTNTLVDEFHKSIHVELSRLNKNELTVQQINLINYFSVKGTVSLTPEELTFLTNTAIASGIIPHNAVLPIINSIFVTTVDKSSYSSAVMLQTKITENVMELWYQPIPGGYCITEEIGKVKSYIHTFNYTGMSASKVLSTIAAIAPHTLGEGSPLLLLCYEWFLTNHNLYHYIQGIPEYRIKNAISQIIKLLGELQANNKLIVPDRLIKQLYSHISKLDNIVNSEVASVSVESWSLPATYNNSSLGLEADGGEDDGLGGDDGLSDDQDDTDEAEPPASDDVSDTNEEDDGMSDDTADDGMGDSENNSEETGEEEPDDTTDDTSEEEPVKKSPNKNTSDSKGITIEISKGETIDSILYRIELSNHITARLRDKTLNNIQTMALKKLKNYWLNYWSIQTILDTLKTIQTLG